jgi:hypothetical protein
MGDGVLDADIASPHSVSSVPTSPPTVLEHDDLGDAVDDHSDGVRDIDGEGGAGAGAGGADGDGGHGDGGGGGDAATAADDDDIAGGLEEAVDELVTDLGTADDAVGGDAQHDSDAEAANDDDMDVAAADEDEADDAGNTDAVVAAADDDGDDGVAVDVEEGNRE